MRISGRAALSRVPRSWKPAVRRSFCAWGTASHSRTSSGPWLAANAPTRLATVQPADEFLVLHADAGEVVAQQGGVGACGKKPPIALLHRLSHLGIERIARQHLVRVGAVLRGERRGLEIKKQ